MADSFTENLNMTKPEVGASQDSWGSKDNSNLDTIDAIFAADGSGTGVGLQATSGKVWRSLVGAFINFIASTFSLIDGTDQTKKVQFDVSGITTGTTRILKFPNTSDTLVTLSSLAAIRPTGAIFQGYFGNTAPTGFVFLNGTSIGSATSGASQRANADTQNLYTLLWQLGFTPTGGRGVNAGTDWTANKPMPVPDHRGRVMATLDNNGGITSAAVLSASGIASTTRAAVGGAPTDPAQTVGVSVSGSISGTASGSISGSADPSVSEVAAAASGSGASAVGHDHSVSGSFSGSVSGSFSGSGSGATASVTNAQPTIMVDCVISL